MKGSFLPVTTATSRAGLSCTGGTLFLDEIGNLPLSLQAKHLSAIEKREIISIGSQHAVPVDIRLICATNVNLLSTV